jgi:hypothetical protein
MTEHKTIEEFNQYLIDNKFNPNIIEYVKELNKIKYKIDISFIDEFIELVNKDDFCIHHDMLQKYGVITLKKGTTDIKRLFEQYELIENEDYRLRNIAEPVKQGGYITKNEYHLHPRAFKICLMRSRNEKKYARYYLLLEEVVKYYNDYQTEIKNKYIIKYKDKINKQKEIITEKDDKIDELIRMNNETNNKINEVLQINKRLDKHSRILEDKLNDANYKLDDVKDDLVDANNKLDLTCKKLNIAVDSRITEPFNKYKLEDFVLLKNRNRKLPYRYYAIRAQTKYVDNKVEKMITVKNYKQLLRINNVPNAVNIWNCLKEATKNKVEYCGNELKLITIDENDFIRMVNEVYDKRKEINIDDDAEYSDTE